MKFKLKNLVVAAVLATTAVSANARITSVSGNTEIFFSAWDVDQGVGYTYDLNWDLLISDLIGVDQAASATGNPILLANANIRSALIDSNGIIFDDVLTGFNTANFNNISNVQWNLASYDTFGRQRLLITLGDSGIPFTTSNDNVRQVSTTLSAYTPAANGFATVIADDTFAITNNTNGIAFPGQFGSNYQGAIADTTNIMGESASLFMLAVDSQNPAFGNRASLVQQLLAFDGREIVARTYLQDNEWRLQIAAVEVAPIPEPETYAMLLAGLGLVGAIARRRNKSA